MKKIFVVKLEEGTTANRQYEMEAGDLSRESTILGNLTLTEKAKESSKTLHFEKQMDQIALWIENWDHETVSLFRYVLSCVHLNRDLLFF